MDLDLDQGFDTIDTFDSVTFWEEYAAADWAEDPGEPEGSPDD